MPVIVDAQPLVDAITAAITAQGLAVGDGEKPTVAAGRPYVVGWFSSAVEDSSMRSRDGFSLTGSFQVYGFDPDSLRWATKKLRTAVLGMHNASVGGRLIGMPSHESSSLPDRDDKADPGPLWWQYDEWRFPTS